MLSKINAFVKENQKELVLLIGVFFISSISFAFGYIIDKTGEKEPLQFEEPTTYKKNE